VGSPNAGAAGAGTAAVNGVPSGPAQAGGTNNVSNDPSGALNANRGQTAPGTVGLASPSQGSVNSGGTNANGTVNEPAPGTNAAGTAGASGGSGGAGGSSANGALRNNGTTSPGQAKPTVTQEQDSDAKINQENQKVNKTVNNICRGC
jgi:hypothetical protein